MHGKLYCKYLQKDPENSIDMTNDHSTFCRDKIPKHQFDWSLSATLRLQRHITEQSARVVCRNLPGDTAFRYFMYRYTYMYMY